MDTRRAQLEQWLADKLELDTAQIRVASADASFRRYFRVWSNGQTRIAMDAPPDKEDSHPFVEIAGMMLEMGLSVPQVHVADFEKGFFLLSDLGDDQYLTHLNADNVELLYGDALSALLRLQVNGQAYQGRLPDYDRALLLREMQLFSDWYLQRHLGHQLREAQQQILDELFQTLVNNALQQPRVFVHRDYHSRNLMWLKEQPERNPGILDFQDAVQGPLTYDLVSLLKDCYIAWPRAQVLSWVEDHYRELNSNALTGGASLEQFVQWFDLMGAQRQLKASGIFARLNHRDGKPGYLDDIPRTLNYILAIADDYASLRSFVELMSDLGICDADEQQVQSS